jgi:protein SCO1/2
MTGNRPGERVIRPQISIGGGFALTDHLGTAVTERSWPGRYLLIFFGFTHCRVVCPRALGKLGAAITLLDESAERLRPLYVTVDPDRDTPDRMRSFLAAYPHFLGLTGPADAIEQIKAAYRVFAQRQATEDSGYDMPHSAITYLVAPDGTLAAHFVDALDAPTIAARIQAVFDTAHTSARGV